VAGLDLKDRSRAKKEGRGKDRRGWRLSKEGREGMGARRAGRGSEGEWKEGREGG